VSAPNAATEIEDKDRGMGECVHDDCMRFAVVGLNGRNLCLPHYDYELTEKRLTIINLMGRLQA
jgi:hypothetical protein